MAVDYGAFDSTLACDHEDDDPFASHKDERGQPVCSTCCPECSKEEDK